jgi:exodeoxyribonuclease VII small subunit
MDQKTDQRSEPSAGAPVAELSFEDALAELERVVDALERGDVPLERSIDLYERGEALREVCEKRLKDAQMRVDRIVAGANGEAAGTVPLDGKPRSEPGPRSGSASDDDIPF